MLLNSFRKGVIEAGCWLRNKRVLKNNRLENGVAFLFKGT